MGCPIDRNHRSYSLYDWNKVILEKTFSIPEKFELSEMISDKATSLDLGELAIRCKEFHNIGPAKDRSVIIRWLRSNYQNPYEFLQKISENWFLAESSTCEVYPKEQEGKLNPRLYGLMTLIRRLYIVITEAFISDSILKYFTEITMTYDQSSLYTRLHQVTTNLQHNTQRASTSIVTDIDFEKWNSNIHESETFDIFSDFDKLFGLTNFFSRSNELFSKCVFYLADGTITPELRSGEMVEDLGVWRNHLWGMEGMRQKGWTVFTAVILKYICELRQMSYQLLGQGDNQVLITHYYQDGSNSVEKQLPNSWTSKRSK